MTGSYEVRGSIPRSYRRRFGIELSYRQAHHAKIKTCSRNPVLRLLFVEVAQHYRLLLHIRKNP